MRAELHFHRKYVSPIVVLALLLSGCGQRETGTVRAELSLAAQDVAALNAGGGGVTVTLCRCGEVGFLPGTEESFPAPVDIHMVYQAKRKPVAAGDYDLRVSLEPGGGRAEVAYVTPFRLHPGMENRLAVEVPRLLPLPPGKPYRRDKYSASGSSATVNFGSSTSFSPWGETLWLYGAAWDGNPNDTNGNEVLVLDWDPVYDADYYELELLVHPFTKNSSNPSANGKFGKVVTTDAEWEALRNTSFTYGGQTKKPSYMRFSGGVGGSDYYKTAYYTINCNTNNQFLSCADKTLARSLFPNKGAAAGKVNASYTVATATDAFDNYTDWSYGGVNRGKVGLEGDCGVIGILLPAYVPQVSLVYRVRAVNQFGCSDWVYWKGGKW